MRLKTKRQWQQEQFKVSCASYAEVQKRAYLGDYADELDLVAYREALTRAWPEGRKLTLDEAHLLGDRVLWGVLGRDERGRDWVEIARERRRAGGAS